ncbi:MAG: hypothetical protein AAGE80_15990 [Pseudomonadota bacterium]
MANWRAQQREARPHQPYLTPLVVSVLFCLGIGLAFAFGRLSASYGIVDIGVFFYSALGFACVTPIAWLLFQLDRAAYARAREANERMGWAAVEAETNRRIAEMRAKNAREEKTGQ